MVADALSRISRVKLKSISIITSDLMQRIQHSWLQDPDLVHMMHSLARNPSKHAKYSWQHNQL